jgi:hypothetical protein
LVELLVALVLSVLVLRLVLPLLSAAKRGDVSRYSDVLPTETWRSVLQADLSSLVSQAKCGVPTARIDRSNQNSAFERLDLQTLSRPGDASRGPLEARYVIEAVEPGRGLGLVRYGQGWHDHLRTRHVLLRDLSSWELTTRSGPPATTSQPTTHPSENTTGRSELLQIKIKEAGGDERIAFFWVGASIEVR